MLLLLSPPSPLRVWREQASDKVAWLNDSMIVEERREQQTSEKASRAPACLPAIPTQSLQLTRSSHAAAPIPTDSTVGAAGMGSHSRRHAAASQAESVCMASFDSPVDGRCALPTPLAPLLRQHSFAPCFSCFVCCCCRVSCQLRFCAGDVSVLRCRSGVEHPTPPLSTSFGLITIRCLCPCSHLTLATLACLCFD